MREKKGKVLPRFSAEYPPVMTNGHACRLLEQQGKKLLGAGPALEPHPELT